MPNSGNYPREIAVRDPIHGFIRLDGFDFVRKVVATYEFQRLRHVGQLGMAPLVYPAATHTRFSHSLGTMHVMERILDHLHRVRIIDKYRKDKILVKTGLAAALLHDIGHGPLSHSSEKWFNDFEHEDISSQIIMRPPISDILKSDGVEPKRVVEVLKGTSKRRDVLLSQLVSSAFDSDRLDYLMRDARFTGAGFGRIDLDRMVGILTVDRKTGFLKNYAVSLYKGRFSIVSYILGRYLMYEAVYFHKATRSAERLILSAFSRIVDIKAFDDTPDCLDFLKTGKKPTVDQILSMDDHTIYELLRRWMKHDDSTLADICRRIYTRRLLKAIELTPDMYRTYHQGVDEKIAKLARNRSFDPDYLCPIDSTSDTPYTTYRPKSSGDVPNVKDSIFVIDQDDEPTEISDMSDVVSALSKTVYHDRLYVPEEITDDVRQLFRTK
jgi:uncharacterized protein